MWKSNRGPFYDIYYLQEAERNNANCSMATRKRIKIGSMENIKSPLSYRQKQFLLYSQSILNTHSTKLIKSKHTSPADPAGFMPCEVVV